MTILQLVIMPLSNTIDKIENELDLFKNDSHTHRGCSIDATIPITMAYKRYWQRMSHLACLSPFLCYLSLPSLSLYYSTQKIVVRVESVAKGGEEGIKRSTEYEHNSCS